MPVSLSKFEIDVMKMLLEGDDNVLSLLRKQFLSLTVQSRKLTGVGFYLDFAPQMTSYIPDEIPSVRPHFCIGGVEATIAGLQHGASFLVWVNDGYITQLEGYAYVESWPAEITNYALSYIDGKRDLEKLRKNWLIQNP
jgi:hypothetical protein